MILSIHTANFYLSEHQATFLLLEPAEAALTDYTDTKREAPNDKKIRCNKAKLEEEKRYLAKNNSIFYADLCFVYVRSSATLSLSPPKGINGGRREKMDAKSLSLFLGLLNRHEETSICL